jgi:fructose-1,6-bisphosphatase/inositol monophosphatase family enzyme
MPSIDLAAVEKIIAEVATLEIMPRFRKLSAADIETKPDKSSVTIADKEAERALIARLKDYLPGSVAIGEEGFESDPAILSHFSGDEYVWVLDPIDGTSHFVAGKPEFATMIGLVRHRQTIAAWIHDPNTGDTLAAERGGGVWLRGHKMALAGRDPSQSVVGIMGMRLMREVRHGNLDALNHLPPIEGGSAAAFDYARLFAGPVQFANSKSARAAYLLYRQTKPWDHIPGLFFVAEAEGHAADFQGLPYDLERNHGLLVAPTRPLWEAVHRVLQPVIKDFKLR